MYIISLQEVLFFIVYPIEHFNVSRFSHGYEVSLEELEEYQEPDFRYIDSEFFFVSRVNKVKLKLYFDNAVK